MKESYEKQEWHYFVEDKNKDTATEDALDLIGKMLVYDKNKRIKVKEAMAHPYFDPIREFIKK